MALISLKIASTDAALGYNLLNQSVHANSGIDRVLVAAALGGSTASGDTGIDINIGAENVGSLLNDKDAKPPTGDDLADMSVFIPAGVELRLMVTDAAESTIFLTLVIEDEEMDDDVLDYA